MGNNTEKQAKMKIAILGTRGMPGRYGGFETFAERLPEELVKRGFKVAVYCPHDHICKDRFYKGVRRLYAFNFEKYLGSAGTILYDISSLIKISLSSCDIVYMLGYASSAFCLIPRIFGKKVVINTDGLEWKRQKWGKLARAYLKFAEWMATKTANHLITDAKVLQKYYFDKYGINTTYLAYGADVKSSKKPQLIKKYGIKPGEYYLIIARLEPENSVDIMLQGYRFSKTQKKLVVVGNPAEKRFMQKLLKHKNENIIFTGGVYDQEIITELRANSYAYLHGHSVGGTNPSLLEAAGCGCLIIARNTPYNKEVIGDEGIYFNTAEEISKIMNSIEEKYPYSKKNKMRKIIKEKFTWEKLASQYAEFFTSL